MQSFSSLFPLLLCLFALKISSFVKACQDSLGNGNISYFDAANGAFKYVTVLAPVLDKQTFLPLVIK